MPCDRGVLNLLSQGGNLGDDLVLTAQVYHRVTEK